MIKKIILFSFLFCGILGYSQQFSASPYSYFGLGEVKFKGTQDARAMGGLGIVGDSIAINLLNPASYSRLKLTSFTVGGTSTFASMKNENQKESYKRTTLDYLAVGIPLKKFGATFGLLPYSAVGYKIQKTTNINNQETIYRYTGDGNVNKVFFGTSYNFSNNFSFGLNLEYNFGAIESDAIESITGVQLATKEFNAANISGFTYNFGLLYDTKINDKTKMFTSLVYAPEVELNVSNERYVATVSYTSSGIEIIDDKQDIAVGDSKLVVPSRLAFGLGFGETNKWMMGSEVTFIGSKSSTNLFSDGLSDTNMNFTNGQKYVVGGYYIPKFDSYSSYLSRVVYRAGLRYEKTGLEISGESINDYGMNFGLGLPVGVSKIDVGFEFGKRGTTNNGLIQENYFNLSIGLSLTDKWFKKTLID